MRHIQKFSTLNEAKSEGKKFFPKKQRSMSKKEILDDLESTIKTIAPSPAVSKERCKQLAVLMTDALCQKFVDGYFAVVDDSESGIADLSEELADYSISFMEGNAKLKKLIQE